MYVGGGGDDANNNDDGDDNDDDGDDDEDHRPTYLWTPYLSSHVKMTPLERAVALKLSTIIEPMMMIPEAVVSLANGYYMRSITTTN